MYTYMVEKIRPNSANTKNKIKNTEVLSAFKPSSHTYILPLLWEGTHFLLKLSAQPGYFR